MSERKEEGSWSPRPAFSWGPPHPEWQQGKPVSGAETTWGGACWLESEECWIQRSLKQDPWDSPTPAQTPENPSVWASKWDSPPPQKKSRG